MKWRLLSGAALLIIIAMYTNACKKNTTATVDCSTVSVSYSKTIQPLVQAKCAISGCHSDLSSYDNLYAKYQSGSLKSQVITQKSMPRSGSLSTSEYQSFYCWISAGAPNN